METAKSKQKNYREIPKVAANFIKGDLVSFEYKGTTKKGHIVNIVKNCTVVTPEGKFRVPPELLTKVI